VDHPATQADKRRRLARIDATSEHISFVPVDLLEGSLDAELARAGHDPAQPSLWVCEGLFPYLPRPTITALCATLRSRSSPGSAPVHNVLVNESPRPLTRYVP
jgi:methyltransferase (TIGR00027 family)